MPPCLCLNLGPCVRKPDIRSNTYCSQHTEKLNLNRLKPIHAGREKIERGEERWRGLGWFGLVKLIGAAKYATSRRHAPPARTGVRLRLGVVSATAVFVQTTLGRGSRVAGRARFGLWGPTHRSPCRAGGRRPMRRQQRGGAGQAYQSRTRCRGIGITYSSRRPDGLAGSSHGLVQGGLDWGGAGR